MPPSPKQAPQARRSSLALIHHLQLTLHTQLRQNRLLQRIWLGGARPAPLDLTVTANQPLLEIPFHTLHAQQTWLFVLEPLEERVGLVAVDVGLAHDGEGDSVVDLAEGLDVVVGAWFLAAELVAGETEDDEVIAW